MRHVLATGLASLLVLAGVAGCASGPAAPTSNGDSSTARAARAVPRPPPAPKPATVAECPYLDRTVVADTNGQGVGEVKISAASSKIIPACFFYRPDGRLQLRTRVYRGPLDTVRALVDLAAPVRTSSRADQPAGWEGGAQATGSGAVYAVAKPDANNSELGIAIIVHTNQAQSVKAREITKKMVRALGW
ncbi:MAG: DUF2020 domain-containing protein [Sciscionella sp.]